VLLEKQGIKVNLDKLKIRLADGTSLQQLLGNLCS